jgi:hypothetical protein
LAVAIAAAVAALAAGCATPKLVYPRASQPSVTVVPFQSTYTQLIDPSGPGGGPGAARSDSGQVFTTGDILLCTVGKPGTVHITDVKAARGAHPLLVVGFATRTNPALETPPGNLMGLNPGSLPELGFPPSGSDVTPCPADYGWIFPAASRATKEFGVSFERIGAAPGEDDGLILTYQAPGDLPRTLSVPMNIVLCPATSSHCGAT